MGSDKLGSMNRLRIIVVDGASDTWTTDPRTTRAFVEMCSLKFRGYGAVYGQGATLPTDTTDFVGVHLIIAESGTGPEGGDRPLLAYRSIDLDTCERFRLVFPALAVAQAAGAQGHVDAVSGLMARARREKLSIRYCSSYTIDPQTRQDRALTAELKGLMVAMHANFHLDYGTGISLLSGVIKVRTHEMFQSWGYRNLTLFQKELPSYGHVSLGHEETLMLSVENGAFSPYALEMAAKYRALWDSRLELKPPGKLPLKRAA
jgi:hypothetical protein